MSQNASDIGAIFLFGVLSLIVLVIGRKRDFFAFDFNEQKWPVPLRWFHVVAVFLIYFAVVIYASPILGAVLRNKLFPGNTALELLGYASWLNFLCSSLILVLFAIFLYWIHAPVRKGIWRRENEKGRPYSDDFRFAALAWLIAFPLVLFLNQLLDWIVTTFFHIQQIPEQLAVLFLKMTFGHPLYLFLAISTIIIFAPLIEETLFRGFLQSFIRQHLGSKQAIFITSLLFSFFHYSPEQGLGNIPIIGSLFALALFLGFVYEKKGSLFAPIALHASFNTISVLNLYFLGGFPKGPI